MVAKILEITNPEIFFGFVAPIGTDIQACIKAFKSQLRALGYLTVELKVTDVFPEFEHQLKLETKLADTPLHDRYRTYIAYGNDLRRHFDDDAILAAITTVRIAQIREKKLDAQQNFEKTAYLLHQFKRKEEIELLRSVYGRLFFQVSVYSRRGARVERLAQMFAKSENTANVRSYRSKAEELVQIDENDTDQHGQRVSKVFHDGDLIINTDLNSPDTQAQVERFCNLLFGSNSVSPTKMEYGMFTAKAAALRTLDLSRQVGAAIFSKDGEIIAVGSNEVPKGGGGTYWSDERFDNREYKRGHDSNDKRKNEILSEILNILDIHDPKQINDKRLSDSQFMDALEYGRIVHAEMSAITDTARLGLSIKDAILFCTTFPCHMCAKHIVASGISKVIFLEPYPKSLVITLHNDSVSIESEDRGGFHEFPSVVFEHFYGISPRRYQELFERTKRKDKHGDFVAWKHKSPQPILTVYSPYYAASEDIIKDHMEQSKNYSPFDDKVYAIEKTKISMVNENDNYD